MVNPVIDFGNGIVVDGVRSWLGRESAGFESPDIDVQVGDYGTMDGGMLGSPRATARQMTAFVYHDEVWSRDEIDRAFAPGSFYAPIVRRVSSPKASMLYLVRGPILYPPNALSKRAFSVPLVSPWAYPRGPRVTFGGTNADNTVTTTTTTVGGGGDPEIDAPTALPLYAVNNAWGQQITLANNASLKDFWLYISRPEGSSPGTFRPMVFLQSGSVWVSVFTGQLTSIPIRTVLTGNPSTIATLNYKNTSGSTQTLIICADDVTANCQMPMTTGGGAVKASAGFVPFTSGGNNAFRMKYTVATPSATSTVCPVVYEGDAPAPARVLIKPSSATSSIIVTAKDAGGAIVSETHMAGSVSAGSIVTIGDDEAERSLLVGSTNRLAWFDMASDWPLATPQTALFEMSVLGNIEVSFEPRYMGLI